MIFWGKENINTCIVIFPSSLWSHIQRIGVTTHTKSSLLGLISSVAQFVHAYVRKISFANKIEAIHEGSPIVRVKVEPRATSCLRWLRN